MQKLIRVLAIIAAVLIALSLVLLLGTLPFQRAIAAKLYTSSDDVIAVLPIFPLATFINCFMLTGCSALLIVCCGNKKGGIWLELILLVAMALVLPAIYRLLSRFMTVAFGQFRGDTYIAANSVADLISSCCMWPGNLGRCLAFVTGGMSIVYKHMSKKLADAGKV